MAGTHAFTAKLEAAGGGAFVAVPLDVEAIWGKKRVKVVATFNGEPYRGSLVRMGGPCHMLIVVKQIRERIGKAPGDMVDVTVREDDEPRLVAVPPDFAAALDQAPESRAFFDALSFTHRREYVAWITEAKREATRATRIQRAVEMLRESKRVR